MSSLSSIKQFRNYLVYPLVLLFLGGYLLYDLLKIEQTEASLLGLPEPTAMLSPSADYSLPILKGLKFDDDNLFELSFVVDSGSLSLGKLKDQQTLRAETKRVVNYFLAALMVEDSQLWVNLSPNEDQRILDDELKMTELGKDMLAQDYLLKQLASSFTHPDSSTGLEYWKQIEHGDLSKIWIKPNKTEVLELDNVVFVSQATLAVDSEKPKSMHPLIEEVSNEINSGKNFARLRQIYNSLILAKWFKQQMTNSVYFDGLTSDENDAKDKIFKLYCDSFKRGVYDLIKQDSAKDQGRSRRYFSGGLLLGDYELSASPINDPDLIDAHGELFEVGSDSRDIKYGEGGNGESWKEADSSIFGSEVTTKIASLLSTGASDSSDKVIYEDVRGGSVSDDSGNKRVRRYRLGKDKNKDNIFYLNKINVFEQYFGAKFWAMKILDKYGLGAKAKVIKINGKRYLFQRHIGGKGFSSVNVTEDQSYALGYTLGLLHRHGVIHGDLYSNQDKRMHGIYRHVLFDDKESGLKAQLIDTGFSRRAGFLSVNWERFGVEDLLLVNINSPKEREKIKKIFSKAYRQAYKDVKLFSVISALPFWASAYQVVVEPIISIGFYSSVFFMAIFHVLIIDSFKRKKPSKAPDSTKKIKSAEVNSPVKNTELGGIDFRNNSFKVKEKKQITIKTMRLSITHIKPIENYSDLLID